MSLNEETNLPAQISVTDLNKVVGKILRDQLIAPSFAHFIKSQVHRAISTTDNYKPGPTSIEARLMKFTDLIPNFDGNQINLQDFIDACDFVVGNINLGDEFFIDLCIKSRLTGSANRVISSKGLHSWMTIRPVLIEYFRNRLDFKSLTRDLNTISQNVDENYETYIRRFVKLSARLRNIISLNTEHNQEQKDSLILQYERIGLKSFLLGLNQPMCGYMRSQNPTNLATALQLLAKGEYYINQLQKRKYAPPSSVLYSTKIKNPNQQNQKQANNVVSKFTYQHPVIKHQDNTRSQTHECKWHHITTANYPRFTNFGQKFQNSTTSSTQKVAVITSKFENVSNDNNQTSSNSSDQRKWDDKPNNN